MTDEEIIPADPPYRQRFVEEPPTGRYRVVRDEWTDLDSGMPLRIVFEWESAEE